ncbi:GspE/PulE family protein [Candidatus Gracilibacteria bacterium]|nr:GspE/PulE family protein [Candidatus Gracilibacteria bacterium]MCF7819217.1 GspE/PulE family protein [Candidatus Gracilibacteria bacterium]
MNSQQNSSFLSTINRGFEERDISSRAQKLGIGYVNLTTFPPNIDILKLIPEESARKAEIFPLDRSGKIFRLAVVDPEKEETKTFLRQLSDEGKKPELYLCSRDGFLEAMKAYSSEQLHKKTIQRRADIQEQEEKVFSQTIEAVAKLEKKLPDMHAESALSEIEVAAVASGASDVHFQPYEKGSSLRFRIDGILHDVLRMDRETAQKITNRVKYEAGMRSNITDIPQDGHRTFLINKRKIDLRISTLPTPFGESVVMRILDATQGIKSFQELGFSSYVREKLLSALHEKSGLILVTGPTGSGKTTTLYSMLAELNSESKKLVTLEDPIEYQLEGVSQSQVDEGKDYDFENGLQALLRHDPDVILVGEIRSFKTAKLASEASLTGHTVLSSLHTSSAVGALSRLRNLGLENFNIAPTLNAVFAQRLIRKICPHCRTKVAAPSDQRLTKSIKNIARLFPEITVPKELSQAQGCEKCSHTGYSGRIAICEAFLMTDEIRKMILNGAQDLEILEYIRSHDDFLTLFEDGLVRVLRGETTLEELYRVAH